MYRSFAISASRIITPANEFYFEPETADCNRKDQTGIILHSSRTHSNTESSEFAINPVKGNKSYHCVKSVCIMTFSGPYFPAFGLNTERYVISLRIQSECRGIQTRETPNTDAFHAVYAIVKCNLIV